mmetsp:Transcript_1287/g.1950  ORF Transcript_1287/g.1950 Transcript_1287/m.1950 type:complete len:295 (+) Transcript_1287:65-949(+)
MLNGMEGIEFFILWIGYFFVWLACAMQVRADSIFHSEAQQNPDAAVTNREGNDSSGDSTRSMFYRLLLFAALSRVALLPVVFFVESAYWSFVAETLPQMTFASAWTLFVSFLVQLVDTALGTGIYTQPSLIIQMIAGGVFLLLLIVALFKHEAFAFIYAFLCLIYLTLFGVILFYGPRLIAVLQPNLLRRSGLAVRLICCCFLCIIVFPTTAFDLARHIFQPPDQEKLWLKCGLLELFPTITILVMMYQSNRVQRQKRSGSSANGKEVIAPRINNSKRKETSTILKNTPSYGAV